ncbi:MAG: carbohydrate kinase family protein [Fimbriimonadaceae bacterium]|nr:carbohydrate kinase family protein [Fimbriimonadaceae bacterium]
MKSIVVAGHLCLDIIPDLAGVEGFAPGRLIEAGHAVTTTGGAVANAGVSLHRLGVPVQLCARIGQDLFGDGIIQILEREGRGLSDGIVQVAGADTSYTVVINLRGQDRMFLHHPGTNATFSSDDLSDEVLRNASHLHFGYPPLMRQIYLDDGRELTEMFRRAKDLGCTTSLDMSLPDSDSESGQQDWRAILTNVLPYVDVFVPSIEELVYMLEPERFHALRGGIFSMLPRSEIERLVYATHALGTHGVMVKLGGNGIVVSLRQPLLNWQPGVTWQSCFPVRVVGTTGAGDATIAGLLYGLLTQETRERSSEFACAVGAYSCEVADATSNIPDAETMKRRLQNEWGVSEC